MNDNEKVIEELRKLIKDRAEDFPFMANFWTIEVFEQDDSPPTLEFGQFNAKLNVSNPFYKPFSRMIDFYKLEGA